MTSVFTAIVNVCVAVFVGVEESVTVTVNVKLPVPDAVPLRTPPLLSNSPGGSVPLVTVALYGCVPPTTGSAWMYGLPTTAVGTVDDVKTSGVLATVKVKLVLADLAGVLLSVTVNASGNEPATVGVPLSTPWLVKVMPAGSAPVSLHVKLPTPPCSSKICVYGCPVDAPASEVVVIAIGASGAVL